MSNIPETTLASPLLEAPYDQFFQNCKSGKYNRNTETGRLVAALQQLPDCPPLETIQRHDPTQTPDLMAIGGSMKTLVDVAVTNLRESTSFVHEYIKALSTGLSDAMGIDSPHLQYSTTVDLSLSKVVVAHYARSLFWQNAVEVAVLAAQSATWIRAGPFLCSRRFTILDLGNGKSCLLTHDAVLMLKDMTYSHFLVTVLSEIDPTRSCVTVALDRYLRWGSKVLRQFGNRGYEILKGIEALSTVRLVEMTEEWLDGQAQAQEMVQKYIKKEQALGGNGDLVREIWTTLSIEGDVDKVAEYFGFLKLMGHPYVNPRTGVEKVKDLVFNPPPKEAGACEEIGFSFCHLYCKGFLHKKGYWPPLKFTYPRGIRTCRLEALSTAQQPALSLGFTQYPATDWRYAEFVPHHRFDMGEDVLAYIADRALSHPRSEFDSQWFGKLDYEPPRPTRSKRVLDNFLQRESLSLSDVVLKVQRREIPDDWKIVSVSPKEREMKLDPRMFAKMVLEMRLFFVLCESNLKKGVFQYMEEQTMTMSRQELVQRFLTTVPPKDELWINLHISIDFSSWNLCWDNENHTVPVGTRLDQMYGTYGVYDYVHDFFSSSLSQLDSSDYPPIGLTAANREDVKNGRVNLGTAYTGHNKGYEGIAQGAWTLSTIALGHLATSDLGFPLVQSGQGDNQIYTFKLRVPRGIAKRAVRARVESVKDDILKRLNTTARRLGHTIKPEECICSTSFYAYGKEMFVDGRYLPSRSKFISRLFPTTKSDTPSFHEYLSSVSSSGIASTDKANTSVQSLVITKLVEHLTMCREMNRSLLHGKRFAQAIQRQVGDHPLYTKTIRDLLCVIPGNLGGLPVSTPLEFMYRGHSDPLSSSLANLRLLKTFPGVDEYRSCLQRDWFYNPKPEINGLVMDPYSLPFNSSTPPSSAVAAEVRPILLDRIVNSDLRGVPEAGSLDEKDLLTSWLIGLKPVYPKIIHDLYKSSLPGLVDSFAKRFTNTRTLSQLTSATGVNLTGISIQADLANLTTIVGRLAKVFKVRSPRDGDPDRIPPTSIFREAAVLRSRWKLGDLHGVTNIHPLYAGTWIKLPDQYKDVTSDREIVVMCYHTNSADCSTTRGPVAPYLGSKTGDKAVGKWIKPLSSSPPFLDLLKVLSIQDKMMVHGSTAWKALDNLAATRTSLPLDLIREFTKVQIGGSDAHRHLTRADAIGSFVNVSPNWPTHLTISSNNSGALGQIDYPHDYQESLTFTQGALSWWKEGTSTEPPFGLVLRYDLSLMDPVEDHILSHDTEYNPLPIVGGSYYLQVHEITVSSRATSTAVLSGGDTILNFPRVEAGIGSALTSLLLNHITGRIRVTTKYGKTLGEISHRRIIDMPEVSYISEEEFETALATAICLKVALPAALISSGNMRPLVEIRSKLISTEVRRSVPSLYGTLKELGRGLSRGTGGVGLGHHNSPRALQAWMVRIWRLSIRMTHRIPVTLFSRGTSSISRGMVAYLGAECVNMMSAGVPLAYQNGKQLASIVSKLVQETDELTKIHLLSIVLRSLGPSVTVSIANSSPEETLRGLRNRQPDEVGVVESNDEEYRYALPYSVIPSCTPTSRPTELRNGRYSPQELIESWRIRGVDFNTAAANWAPLRYLYPVENVSVLLIGVGNGKIGHAFPLSWRVTGVDLGRILSHQGQAMVNYRPPDMPQIFTLHPVSWTLGGDITSTEVVRSLVSELELGVYDLVIIDVDDVSPSDRLRVRQKLAMTGIPTWVRVFTDLDDVEQLLLSVASVSETGDRVWASEHALGMEYIVGPSASPMGLYMASETELPDGNWPPLITARDIESSRSGGENLDEHYFNLVGDFPQDGNRTVNPYSCPALRSYLPAGLFPVVDLLPVLLEKGCPRRRVRSLFVLSEFGCTKEFWDP